MDLAEDDPGLAVIVAGWSKLSADARRAVVELVEAELGAGVGELVAADRGM
ncbi:MAG: hypothetical protein NT013_16555 [Planctomycetia bacterium]|nr:hypothetical protein [Planctomycetia bacterium]